MLRAVVDAMDGMRARSCRIAQPGPDTAIDVALTVVARFGLDLASATARVRQTVFAAGEQALGLPRAARRHRGGGPVGGVTLHVADAAVTSMAAAAARQVPGVVAARADLAAELVRVTIAVRLGDNCRDVAEAVQRGVTHTLAELAGRTALVEVTVAEVVLR